MTTLAAWAGRQAAREFRVRAREDALRGSGGLRIALCRKRCACRVRAWHGTFRNGLRQLCGALADVLNRRADGVGRRARPHRARRPGPDRGAVEDLRRARAAAEIERSRAEQSYREILDAADDAIFVHDWDTGAIIDVSAKAADLFGYSREDLKRLRVGDLSADVAPYTEADAMVHIERAKQSDSPLRFEWRAKHRDGTLVWHEVTLKRAQVVAIAVCSPSSGTLRSGRPRRTRCRCANTSTARFSTARSTRWCCGTTRSASPTSIARSPKCTASRAKR